LLQPTTCGNILFDNLLHALMLLFLSLTFRMIHHVPKRFLVCCSEPSVTTKQTITCDDRKSIESVHTGGVLGWPL
jgi:hypothetical protein